MPTMPRLLVERCIPDGYIASMPGTFATGRAETPAFAAAAFYKEAERRLALLTQRNWPSDLGEVALLKSAIEREKFTTLQE